MIRNIIFDFGDVFIDLDKEVLIREIKPFPSPEVVTKVEALNNKLEIGAIGAEAFLAGLHEFYPDYAETKLEEIWNSMLLELPEKRLQYVEKLSVEGKYRLFLLSNTNAIHIPFVKNKLGPDRWQRFRNCFEKFYLSHEIGLRKPDSEIFEFVLSENGLMARETLFIDDTQSNIEGARMAGLQTWHLQPGKEEVTDLEKKLSHD